MPEKVTNIRVAYNRGITEEYQENMLLEDGTIHNIRNANFWRIL